MSKCKYCHNEFEPRPQVKFPKACKRLKCQKQRQRDNERDWHARQLDRFDRKYHNLRKKLREKRIEHYVQKLHRAMIIGMTFCGYDFDSSCWLRGLRNWFLQLGIRRINKLWSLET